MLIVYVLRFEFYQKVNCILLFIFIYNQYYFITLWFFPTVTFDTVIVSGLIPKTNKFLLIRLPHFNETSLVV